MENNTSSKGLVWIAVLVVLIGLGTYFAIGRGDKGTMQGTEADNLGSTSRIADSVEAKDQLAGNSVIISNIALDKGGFVVIKASKDGQPGDTIGAKYFERGERPGTVELTANTKNGGIYFAVLYSDDGDKKFDPAKDLPLKNASGNTIMQSFKILNELPEVKG